MFIRKLYHTKLIKPSGLYRLVAALLRSGVNLMALLRYAGNQYGEGIAVTDEYETLTYSELFQQSTLLALNLAEKYDIKPGKKVAIMCRNNAVVVRAVFAAAYTGADIYMLNAEMSQGQFYNMLAKYAFDLIIHDDALTALVDQSPIKVTSLPAYNPSERSANRLSKTAPNSTRKIKARGSGKIIVLTGGTTGDFKIAARKPSVINYLPPFFSLINKLDPASFHSVYIATPIYHGFGLAGMLMSVMLGAKIFIAERFDAEAACQLIKHNRVQVAVVVPLMLARMVKLDCGALKFLNCILSGGAALTPSLVNETATRLGDILYNLYGTSEAGFSIMATPTDLSLYPSTIGRPIKGVHLAILDADGNEVDNNWPGRICIKSSWTVNNAGWVETGDLGFRDENGYYYLCGKTDDMIVSGGENVYPVELENILSQHPEISQSAVIGINDHEFGQRLKAFVVPVAGSAITEHDITAWLSTRVARYQTPKYIEIATVIPHTSLGKPDKKLLKELHSA